jgi:hypothetical protein
VAVAARETVEFSESPQVFRRLFYVSAASSAGACWRL